MLCMEMEGKGPVYQTMLFGFDATQEGQCISDVNTLPELSKTGGDQMK